MRALMLFFVLLFVYGIFLGQPKAEEFKHTTYIYHPNDHTNLVVTDIICSDVSNPDNLPLREAYIMDMVSLEKVEGCGLLYKDLIEVQLFDGKNKKHIDLRVPMDKWEVQETQ